MVTKTKVNFITELHCQSTIHRAKHEHTVNIKTSLYMCYSMELSKHNRDRGFKVPTKQTNSVALSPQANYTDYSTDTCRRNLVSTFVDRGVSRGQRGGSPAVVNLRFLDRSQLHFFQVAPHLLSQGLSGPRSRPTATQKIW
jgi:hypothetical protein